MLSEPLMGLARQIDQVEVMDYLSPHRRGWLPGRLHKDLRFAPTLRWLLLLLGLRIEDMDSRAC